MDNYIVYLILIVTCFIIGSIPTGLVVSKIVFGFDIRERGSGNIGSTNVFRVLGKKWGIFVQIFDVAKAFFAVLLVADLYVRSQVGDLIYLEYQVLIQLVAGISAVFGHIFSIFLKFKGGKGVSTIAGMLFAIAPFDFSFVIIIFLFLIFTSGYISLGAILGGMSFPLIILIRRYVFGFQHNNFEVLIAFACLVSIIIIVTHIANIKRLIKGEENGFDNLKIIRFGKKRTS